MARTFYAFEHQYGRQMADRRGHSIGAVYQFSTLAARDRWVGQGTDYQTQAGYREPISATSREVRSATRSDYWTVLNGDGALAELDALEAERDYYLRARQRDLAALDAERDSYLSVPSR